MSSFTPLINQSNELLERKHYHIETIDYLLVSPADQKLFHISNKQILKNYSVSTSRFGLGNLMDSFKTPVGLHCIEEKIGSGMPMNTIFKGRKPIRNNMTLEDLYNDKKLIVMEEVEITIQNRTTLSLSDTDAAGGGNSNVELHREHQ